MATARAGVSGPYCFNRARKEVPSIMRISTKNCPLISP
ncbi:Uncharacterised protein [Mycobacterium tuberculosis]|nr:Uncharacterised protein [Mycobacterium tuberculosis]